jgi:hypothetical protein
MVQNGSLLILLYGPLICLSNIHSPLGLVEEITCNSSGLKVLPGGPYEAISPFHLSDNVSSSLETNSLLPERSTTTVLTKILETESVHISQYSVKSKKEEDYSGLGSILTGVYEDSAEVESKKPSAVKQELGQGSRPSNYAYKQPATRLEQFSSILECLRY